MIVMKTRKEFSHITLEKRKEISKLLENGKTAKEISTLLNIHISSVYRELERGRNPQTGHYDAEYSDANYRGKLAEKGKDAFFLENRLLGTVVAQYILELGLSPAEIVRKLKEDGCSPIPSAQTIYSAIDAGYIPGVTRESLRSKETSIFSDGTLRLPKWIRDELSIEDGDVLLISYDKNSITLTKREQMLDK